ncbi:hypothetical protein JIK52_28970 (plasmid) [Klebsiella variicola]|nr:hypothetical protein [Klebsiella variicola]QQM89042.1 hypothetical protein JIK52_28970 [Klebsiella variicola]
MGSCAAPSAKGDDKFITTDYLQQCHFDINLDVVWETVQEWLPALLQQLPAVRQDADDEDRNDNCERGISDDC